MAHAQKIKKSHLHKSGLIYVEESPPGIQRRKCGRGYSFIGEDGKCIKNKKVRARLLKIAVPPSYQNVWYCPEENGHLQATGLDANQKKQYFYHVKWEELRDTVKFSMMSEFGAHLPLFRSRIYRILKEPQSDHDYVLAGMARILDRTGMRVGNDLATKKNKTFGLTTLRENHIEFDPEHIQFDYKGKGCVDIHTEITDKKILDVIDYCTELPGKKLFKYQDENKNIRTIDSGEFNQFLKDHIGQEFSAKDFRTWRFSVFFLDEILSAVQHDEKFVLKNMLQNVSEKSGNTPSILQKSYIHPALIDAAKNDRRAMFKKSIDITNGLLKSESRLLSLL